MKKSIHTSVINGEINAPSSKSYTIRALAGALLSDGYSIILKPAICEDVKAAIEVIECLGAEVEISKNSFLVKGGLNLKRKIINCGESALCVRLFSAIAPILSDEIIIQGKGTILNRSFADVVEGLNSLGVICESERGYLPLKIKGSYTKSEVSIDCSVSSQFLSGLLFALPLIVNDTKINIINLKSKPYISLTMDILKQFGIKIKQNNFEEFNINGKQSFQSTNISVEGDWSNSAFLLVAGAIAGSVKVRGLNLNSYQGDRKILEVLDKAGAIITIDNESLQVKMNILKTFNYDATDTPDLFPPLVILALGCDGTSKIAGTNRLLNKESNRLKALISEFTKLGIKIYEEDNTLNIEGGKVFGCEVDSHNDHRIAMALAVAGLKSESPVIINDAECVKKSYPDFFNDLKNIGGQIDE